jgi:hypothetical protein
VPVADLEEVAARLSEIASDSSRDPAERIAALRRMDNGIESIQGQIATYISSLELQREAGAIEGAVERLVARENADIREQLLDTGDYTEAELDAAGYLSHEALDEAAEDGTLQEAFGLVDPALLRRLAARRRRNKGKFADEFGSLAKPKSRGGTAQAKRPRPGTKSGARQRDLPDIPSKPKPKGRLGHLPEPEVAGRPGDPDWQGWTPIQPSPKFKPAKAAPVSKDEAWHRGPGKPTILMKSDVARMVGNVDVGGEKRLPEGVLVERPEKGKFGWSVHGPTGAHEQLSYEQALDVAEDEERTAQGVRMGNEVPGLPGGPLPGVNVAPKRKPGQDTKAYDVGDQIGGMLHGGYIRLPNGTTVHRRPGQGAAGDTFQMWAPGTPLSAREGDGFAEVPATDKDTTYATARKFEADAPKVEKKDKAKTPQSPGTQSGYAGGEMLPIEDVDSYVSTRNELNRIANLTIAPAQRPTIEVKLKQTPGGFGTPVFINADGKEEQWRVEGDQLIRTVDGKTTRERIKGIDPDQAHNVAQFYDLANRAISGLVPEGTDVKIAGRDYELEPDFEASETIIWPEHFDQANMMRVTEGTPLHPEKGNVNIGASPGDIAHPTPYFYIGPWAPVPKTEDFDADGFMGAMLDYDEVLKHEDQAAFVRDWYQRHIEALKKLRADDPLTDDPDEVAAAEEEKAPDAPDEYTAKRVALDVRSKREAKTGVSSRPPASPGTGSAVAPQPDPNAPRFNGKASQKELLAYVNNAKTKASTVDEHSSRDADGNRIYDTGRKAIHDRIIAKMLKGVKSQPPGEAHVFFTGGGYAAGKGGVVNNHEGVPPDALVLDPDKIKAELPEFQELLESDPEANLLVYEEAWDISQEIQRRAIEMNANVVVDGISDTSPEDMLGRVKLFKDAGYKDAKLVTVSIPTEEAIARADNRARKAKKPSDRRFIPEVIMRSVHRDVSATMPGIIEGAKDLGLEVEIWDNDQGVAEDGSFNPPKRFFYFDPAADEPTVEDEDLYQAFLAKAEEQIEGVEDDG